MQFSKVALLSAVSGSALASWSNSTVTDISTKIITITSCSLNSCVEKTIETGVTTVTEVDTTYTTYCPLPTTEAPVPASTVKEIETVTATITSCSEDKCTTKEVLTGLTTLTDVHTTYTTYCPLPSTEAGKPAVSPETHAPAPATTVAAESSPAASETTVVSKSTVAAESSAAPSPAPTVVEGSAAKAVPALAGLLALGAFI
ncbi:hypothetical protein KGF54_001907 [Candida jiufengensis]|uniref:uncharacterized protein n=1 Tax=Candida jiufengensis TaxID=497108 RepID=UPI002224687C|nr:uncharacterized protein KGF54_001907 [Candida jiufengensis]KAI5955346.1 hypothetical protein KGF54_001907 [Candida jiufengensis]